MLDTTVQPLGRHIANYICLITDLLITNYTPSVSEYTDAGLLVVAKFIAAVTMTRVARYEVVTGGAFRTYGLRTTALIHVCRHTDTQTYTLAIPQCSL